MAFMNPSSDAAIIGPVPGPKRRVRLVLTRIACLAFAVLLFSSLSTTGATAAGPRTEGFGRLAALEDRAEGIAGGEQTGAAARTAAAQIVARWPAVRADFAAEQAAHWSLSAVDGEVAALRSASDGVTLQRAANEATGALAPLFALAGDPVPVSVRLLDYLGRSIALDARAGDWGRAAEDGANVERTWVTLRPRVLEHHGQAAAAATDRAVAALKTALRAQSATRVAAGAHGTGIAVDLLEKVFGD